MLVFLYPDYACVNSLHPSFSQAFSTWSWVEALCWSCLGRTRSPIQSSLGESVSFRPAPLTTHRESRLTASPASEAHQNGRVPFPPCLPSSAFFRTQILSSVSLALPNCDRCRGEKPGSLFSLDPPSNISQSQQQALLLFTRAFFWQACVLASPDVFPPFPNATLSREGEMISLQIPKAPPRKGLLLRGPGRIGLSPTLLFFFCFARSLPIVGYQFLFAVGAVGNFSSRGIFRFFFLFGKAGCSSPSGPAYSGFPPPKSAFPLFPPVAGEIASLETLLPFLNEGFSSLPPVNLFFFTWRSLFLRLRHSRPADAAPHTFLVNGDIIVSLSRRFFKLSDLVGLSLSRSGPFFFPVRSAFFPTQSLPSKRFDQLPGTASTHDQKKFSLSFSVPLTFFFLRSPPGPPPSSIRETLRRSG